MTRRSRRKRSVERRLDALEIGTREEYPEVSLMRILGASAVGGPTGKEGENNIVPVAPDEGLYRFDGELRRHSEPIPVARGAITLDDEGREVFIDDPSLGVVTGDSGPEP